MMTTFEGHWCTAGLHSTLVVYYGYCVLLYFIELHQYTFFYITVVLSVRESDLSTCESTSNPQVHIKPTPVPMKTHTHRCGYGCRLPKKNPRVTCEEP